VVLGFFPWQQGCLIGKRQQGCTQSMESMAGALSMMAMKRAGHIRY
jgi:hypothetical protein